MNPFFNRRPEARWEDIHELYCRVRRLEQSQVQAARVTIDSLVGRCVSLRWIGHRAFYLEYTGVLERSGPYGVKPYRLVGTNIYFAANFVEDIRADDQGTPIIALGREEAGK